MVLVLVLVVTTPPSVDATDGDTIISLVRLDPGLGRSVVERLHGRDLFGTPSLVEQGKVDVMGDVLALAPSGDGLAKGRCVSHVDVSSVGVGTPSFLGQ